MFPLPALPKIRSAGKPVPISPTTCVQPSSGVNANRIELKPFDASGAFKPAAPDGGTALRQAAVRSAGAMVFFGGVGLGVQIISTMTLARLLIPADFGVVTMVTTSACFF